MVSGPLDNTHGRVIVCCGLTALLSAQEWPESLGEGLDGHTSGLLTHLALAS